MCTEIKTSTSPIFLFDIPAVLEGLSYSDPELKVYGEGRSQYVAVEIQIQFPDAVQVMLNNYESITNSIAPKYYPIMQWTKQIPADKRMTEKTIKLRQQANIEIAKIVAQEGCSHWFFSKNIERLKGSLESSLKACNYNAMQRLRSFFMNPHKNPIEEKFSSEKQQDLSFARHKISEVERRIEELEVTRSQLRFLELQIQYAGMLEYFKSDSYKTAEIPDWATTEFKKYWEELHASFKERVGKVDHELLTLRRIS